MTKKYSCEGKPRLKVDVMIARGNFQKRILASSQIREGQLLAPYNLRQHSEVGCKRKQGGEVTLNIKYIKNDKCTSMQKTLERWTTIRSKFIMRINVDVDVQWWRLHYKIKKIEHKFGGRGGVQKKTCGILFIILFLTGIRLPFV